MSLISLFCAHVLFLVCVIPCFPSMFISLDLLIFPSVVSSQSPCHVMVYCLPLCHVSLPSSLLSAFPPLVCDIRQFPVLFWKLRVFMFGVVLVNLYQLCSPFSFPSNPSVYLCQYAFPCVLPHAFSTSIWAFGSYPACTQTFHDIHSLVIHF